MATTRYVVVDDDAGVRGIIRNVIAEHDLGTVVAEVADGLSAEKAIRDYRPDIAIIDLLLPGQDGVTLIKRLRETDLPVSYIMISESSNQPMITQAYETGIEFYIHKPLNVLEVVSVIMRVKENRNLKMAMSLITQATAQYGGPKVVMAPPDENKRRDMIYKVFSDLGILGEVGAKNIHQMTEMVEGTGLSSSYSTYQLVDIYKELSQSMNQDTKTIEQRVRRTITKALQNVAGMGVEDYYNDKFQTYSTALFDFAEVRQEMSFIQGKSPYHGKINVRKFIEGLVFLTTSRQPRD